MSDLYQQFAYYTRSKKIEKLNLNEYLKLECPYTFITYTVKFNMSNVIDFFLLFVLNLQILPKKHIIKYLFAKNYAILVSLTYPGLIS